MCSLYFLYSLYMFRHNAIFRSMIVLQRPKVCGSVEIIMLISWCVVFIFCVSWCFHILFIVLGMVFSFAIYVLVCVSFLFRCLYGFLVLRVKCVKSFVYLQFLVLFIPYEQVLAGTPSHFSTVCF